MSIKIFLDTSIFIRLFTDDDPAKNEHCKVLFQKINEGKLRPYVSQIVIIEIIFVLMRLYHFPKVKVLEAIEELYTVRNMTVIEKTNTKEALRLFGKYKIKYQDCLIAVQVPTQCTLVTYDAEFKQIPRVQSTQPEEMFKVEYSSTG